MVPAKNTNNKNKVGRKAEKQQNPETENIKLTTSMNTTTSKTATKNNKKQFALGQLIHARNTGRKVEALFLRTRLDQRDQRIISGIECSVNGLPVFLPSSEFIPGETVDTFREKKTIKVCVAKVNFSFAVVSQKLAAARDAFEATLKPETDEQFRELKVIAEQQAKPEQKQSHRFWVALGFGIKAALYDEGISAGSQVKVNGNVRVRIRSAKDGKVTVTMLTVEEEKARHQASRPEQRRHQGNDGRQVNSRPRHNSTPSNGANSRGNGSNDGNATGKRSWTNGGNDANREGKSFKSQRRSLSEGSGRDRQSPRHPFGRDRRFKAPKANESTDWRKDLAAYHSKVESADASPFAALSALSK